MPVPEDVRSYIERGWQVFPIHSVSRGVCTCAKGAECSAKGKHPVTKNGVYDATNDWTVIESWWDAFPWANVAVATGRASGMFVVDVDPRHGGFDSMKEWYEQNGRLPDTLTSYTGGGGRHLIWQYPAEDVAGRQNWLPGVDVKSDGGYIVVPPSSHESGQVYAWHDKSWIPGPPPAILIQDINERAGEKRDLMATPDILEGVPEGMRDDTLFRAACRWRRMHEKEPDGGRAAVTALVLEAARKSAFPEDEALKKVDQAFKQDHTDPPIPQGIGLGSGTADPDEFRHLTDDGNAYRLIDHYGGNFRFTGALGWLYWCGTHWEQDELNRITSHARSVHTIISAEAQAVADPDQGLRFMKWATMTESAGKIQAMMKLAEADDRVAISTDVLDSDPYLLCCTNGVVDLRTGELMPHDPDMLMTMSTRVEYDPDFTLPEWDYFINESCEGNEDLVKYMQRVAGYTLTGLTTEEAFFILQGPAASGKSTFIDGLQAALGDYAITTQSDTLMYKRGGEAPTTELARLAGKRLVYAVEVAEGERMNEALIKQITGGDQVTGRFLYKTQFTYRPQFTLWIATNHSPRIMDEAIWRRVKRVPFWNAVPKERRDPKLKQMISDPEIGGKAVLAWAVKGCQEWMAGGLHEPAIVQVETEDYRTEQDRFGAFIESGLIIEQGHTSNLDLIFNRYRRYCEQVGDRPMAMMTFVGKMRERGFPVRRNGRDKFIEGVIPAPEEQRNMYGL